MVDVSCERGAANVSVADVVQRSGVSRRTFYEVFVDKDDCFLATFEQVLDFAAGQILRDYDPSAPWRERIRRGMLAVLSFLDREPSLGRVLLVESLSAGPRVLERRREIVEKLIAIVEEARLDSKAVGSLPALAGEGVVGSVLSILQNRLLDPDRGALTRLTGELTSMVVMPYFGMAAAKRELELPVPESEPKEPARAIAPLHSDPFKDAGMRLTYRTVRVLRAVAEHPGASNRAVGNVAEISDPGQISKLLNRLAKTGMLANAGTGPDRGAPNVWTLTDTGLLVLESIRMHNPNSASDGRGDDGDNRKASL